MYDRIVSAALAETVSKFRLAEALALDIPQRPRGPAPVAEPSVTALLTEARQAIIGAGGEPRDTATLDYYRRTALWVLNGTVQNFSWLPGTSYTAHSEARAAGLSYEQFAALPPAERTVDAIRRRAGKAGTDGQPDRIVQSWTPDQQAAAARELMAQPDTAAAAFREPAVRQAAANAIVNDPDVAKAATEALDERRRTWTPPAGAQPWPGPAPVDPAEADEEARMQQLILNRADLMEARRRIDAVLRRGVGEADRPVLASDAAAIRRHLDALDALVGGKPLDEELLELIQKGGE